MILDAKLLQNIIDAENPLQVVWEYTLKLWQVEVYPENLVAFYNDRETLISQFEQALYHGYFEIYDLLLEHARHQDGSYVHERLQGDNTVIIADSLSMREVGLLKKRLGEHGWNLELEGFSIVPFPTLTESLSIKLLGTNPAGGKDTASFRYRYLTGPGEMPNLPAKEATLVWLRLPDKELEHVTVAQATTVTDAFNITVETLIRLLKQLTNRHIFITSDHGYLYATSPAHYWEMPRGIEDDARKVFSRESRAQLITKENEVFLPRNEPSEQRHFVFYETHVGILGRYWWASARASDRCTGHGGLSLTEIFVPIISVTPL